jgi:hypothetical protein
MTGPAPKTLALDYGSRRKPRQQAMVVAAVALALLALSALVFVWATDRATRMAHARAWTVTGPPCAAATGPLSPSADTPPQITEFEAAKFARLHGAIRCTEVGYDGGRDTSTYPVCQLDHPGRVQVATAAGVSTFDLGPLNGAVISIPHGAARCVVGQNLAAD